MALLERIDSLMEDAFLAMRPTIGARIALNAASKRALDLECRFYNHNVAAITQITLRWGDVRFDVEETVPEGQLLLRLPDDPVAVA